MELASDMPSDDLSPPSQDLLTLNLSNDSHSLAVSAPFVTPKSPASSFASKESYSTAISSSSLLDLDTLPTAGLAPNSQPNLLPSQSLRKSVSVDSFVQYGRDTHPPVITRPNRGHTGSALEAPRGLVGLTRELDHTGSSGRARGDSVSSVRSSLAGDSDVDRSDAFNSPTDRYRHVSLKGQEQTRAFNLRGGELPLPSRTPTLSTTSSMSSIATASTSSSTQEAAPVLGSASSLQSAPRQVATSSGRTRSGSLGVYTSNTGRRMLINTQLPPHESNQAVTLVVIGTASCGKTTAIRKGLKNYNLSEPSAPLPGTQSSVPYVRRQGKLIREDGVPDCPLNVIEVDITPVMLESLLSGSRIEYLPEALKVDGVIICYDASKEASFRPVEELLRAYRALQLPVIVLACKSDLERRVDPQGAVEILQQYDAGLVEVNSNESGREKMKRSFDWLFKAIVRDRRSSRSRQFEDYRNPASPEVLRSPSWDMFEGSRTATPIASSSTISTTNYVPPPGPIVTQSSLPTIPSPRTSTTPNSSSRARSTGDLSSEHERAKYPESSSTEEPEQSSSTGMRGLGSESVNGAGLEIAAVVDDAPPPKVESKEREARPAQWATLDELLDKLLFLAVSGDDPTYITHFLLTYRRFASPRSVILAMQKRMRQLDNPSGDPMFACFAQMRICHLLETWKEGYPYDFAVRGTAGALSALITSIISKTYLLHYGSDFLPFLEMLPTLVDRDNSWAFKIDDSADESDDSYSLLEDDDESIKSGPIKHSFPTQDRSVSIPSAQTRERKSSLPLTAKSLLSSSSISTGSAESDSTDFTPKQQLRELVRLANEVNTIDPGELAQEITRIEKRLFLDIEPRDWLQYTFVSGKKDPEKDTIARFNNVSNHLADWVVSLILCHDSPRLRAKQIEKFAEVAQKLRALNNYSALRAFVAGINNSTFPGDQTMERFKSKSPEHAKNLQSWDVLLQHIRAHRAYRLALRNTKGACIPALEVHMSDLIRAHEANDDFNSSDRSKIHWGKFNMMGRFITSTTQCQAQCRSTTDYDFPERPYIRNLLITKYLMDDEMQKSRIAPPDTDYMYDEPPNPPATVIRDSQSNTQPRNVNVTHIRRWLFGNSRERV